MPRNVPFLRRTFLLLTLFVASCATVQLPEISRAELNAERQLQLQATLKEARDQLARTDNLLWPLIASNTRFCRNQTTPQIGIRYASPISAGPSPKIRAAVRESIYNFDQRTVIYAVADSSPAALAGIQPGDRIRRIGNWVWSRDRANEFNNAVTKRLAAVMRTGSVLLEIERDGELLQFNIAPVSVCNVDLELEPSLDVQARTNGREIVISQGMADRLDDEQIRTVLAHELAHCAMGHIRRATMRAASGLIADIAFLSQRVWLGGVFTRLARDASSIGLEREADYVSMYLLANAGLDTSKRADIWRELADEVTYTNSVFTTHPFSPERYLLLSKTHNEIEAKRRANQALVPTGM